MPIKAPKIPVFERQQIQGQLPRFRQSENALDANALGAVVRGVSDAGRAARDVGDAFDKVRREQNEAELNGLVDKLIRARIGLFEDKENGLQVKKNKDAIDSGQQFLDDFNQFGNGLRGNISSPDVKKAFDESFLKQQFAFKRVVNGHVAKESRSLAKSNFESLITSHTNAAISAAETADFASIFSNMSEIEAAVAVFAETSDMPDRERDVNIRALKAAAVVGVVNKMIDGGQLDEARLFIDGDPRDKNDKGVRPDVDEKIILASRIDKVLGAKIKEKKGLAEGDEAFVRFGVDDNKALAHLRRTVKDSVALGASINRYFFQINASNKGEVIGDRDDIDSLKLLFLEGKGEGLNTSKYERLSENGKVRYRQWVESIRSRGRAEINDERRRALDFFRERTLEDQATTIIDDDREFMGLPARLRAVLQRDVNRAKRVVASDGWRELPRHIDALGDRLGLNKYEMRRMRTGVKKMYVDEFSPDDKVPIAEKVREFMLRLNTKTKPRGGGASGVIGRFFSDPTIAQKLAEKGGISELLGEDDGETLFLPQQQPVSSSRPREPTTQPQTASAGETLSIREQAIQILNDQGYNNPNKDQIVFIENVIRSRIQ